MNDFFKKLTTDSVCKAVISKGYKWDDTFNIVWFRTNDKQINVFNDFATLSLRDKLIWKTYVFKSTTDPGLYWLESPMNVKGTAILKPGQYADCWRRGMHKDQYALIQDKPVTVYRDRNKDDKLDFGIEIETGMFGLDSHRANEKITSIQVDKWSAGCLVIASPSDHKKYMDACDLINRKNYTITLLEENDVQ